MQASIILIIRIVSFSDLLHILAYELLEAHEGRGGAVKKKSEVQRMAEANRAFSHYAW